jgi:hypothetical protein
MHKEHAPDPLRSAVDHVLRGERDALIFEMTDALERLYGDSPTDPMAAVLLPAYRIRCGVLRRVDPG